MIYIKKLILLQLFIIGLCFDRPLFAQVIPVGTVIKGKRLPTVFCSADEDAHGNSVAFLEGYFILNDSKLPIIEKGFVILKDGDPSIPDI